MRFVTKFILPMFFCAIYLVPIAQNEFTTFSKSDGLTSTNILFTYCDSKGIIWAATNNGLNAYTGKEWISIRSIIGSDGNDQLLGEILSIFESSSAELWISTNNGLFLFNRKYWTFYSDHENREFHVDRIFEDRSGIIWILMEKSYGVKDVGELGFSFVEGRLQMFNGSQWFDFPGMIGGSATVLAGEPQQYFTSFIQSENGDLWATSLDGLYNYNGIKWTEYNEEVLTSDKCYDVIETSKNEIWVATANGISKKDGDKWIKYEKFKGIKDNVPSHLLEDSKNRIWAFIRKDHKFKSLCYFENNKWESCFNNDIQIKGSISELINFNGNMLAFSSKGISFFDSNKWTNAKELYDLKDDDFSNLTILKDKSIVFAGSKGVYKLTNNSLYKILSPSSKWKVNSIFESSSGEIWVGTDKDGVYRIADNNNTNYNNNNGLNDNTINTIFEDKRNNIWVISKNAISLFTESK